MIPITMNLMMSYLINGYEFLQDDEVYEMIVGNVIVTPRKLSIGKGKCQ